MKFNVMPFHHLLTITLIVSSCKTTNMPLNSPQEVCLSYLKKYEEKDLKSIEQMFSDDIILRDWKIRVEGKEEALTETRKNFASAETIKIDVLSIYKNENAVAAELKILIDSKDELNVIDIITINPEGRISSIKAFLGRGEK